MQEITFATSLETLLVALNAEVYGKCPSIPDRSSWLYPARRLQKAYNLAGLDPGLKLCLRAPPFSDPTTAAELFEALSATVKYFKEFESAAVKHATDPNVARITEGKSNKNDEALKGQLDQLDPKAWEIHVTEFPTDVMELHDKAIDEAWKAINILEGLKGRLMSGAGATSPAPRARDQSGICAQEKPHEIFELKPNFHGIGVNLKTLWRRLFAKKKI